MTLINCITGRLLDILNDPSFLGPHNPLQTKHQPVDWQLVFEEKKENGEETDGNKDSDDDEEIGTKTQLTMI